MRRIVRASGRASAPVHRALALLVALVALVPGPVHAQSQPGAESWPRVEATLRAHDAAGRRALLEVARHARGADDRRVDRNGRSGSTRSP